MSIVGSQDTEMRQRDLYHRWITDPLKASRVTLAHHAMRALPTAWVSWIGSFLARTAASRLHPKADRRMRLALETLRPDLKRDPTTLKRAVASYWESQGRTYAEFSAEDRLWEEGRIKVEGEQHLTQPRERGRSIIIAGVHLGNWEVLPISFGYLGHRFVQVYQPLSDAFENRIAVKTRMRANQRVRAACPGAGCRLLPPSPNSSVELLRALKAGESFMMFVDEEVNKRVQAPAFDAPPRIDGNLARVVRLARLSGAAIIPAYVVRERGAHFTVHYLPELPLQTTSDRNADLHANVTALNSRIAPVVQRHLDQWYMLMSWRQLEQ